MKRYARIERGQVAELLSTDADIAELFHPSLEWVAVSDPAVSEGWTYNGRTFAAPATAASASDVAAILILPPTDPAALRDELLMLQQRISALAARIETASAA